MAVIFKIKDTLPPSRTISRQLRDMTAVFSSAVSSKRSRIRLLVLLEGLPVDGIAPAHGHLVDAVAAQRAFAVEQRRFGNNMCPLSSNATSSACGISAISSCWLTGLHRSWRPTMTNAAMPCVNARSTRIWRLAASPSSTGEYRIEQDALRRGAEHFQRHPDAHGVSNHRQRSLAQPKRRAAMSSKLSTREKSATATLA